MNIKLSGFDLTGRTSRYEPYRDENQMRIQGLNGEVEIDLSRSINTKF